MRTRHAVGDNRRTLSARQLRVLSSGTWSLFGTEIPEPIVNNTSLSINITNEGGYGGMTGLLKI